jgi:hypothetical protein
MIAPNPPGMVAGDAQLVCISYFNPGAVTWPTTGWYEIFDGLLIAGEGSYGTGRQKVFWRKWNGTDPAFEITPSSGIDIVYASVAVRNQNDADPIFTGYMFNPHETPEETYCPVGPAQYLECANPGDLFFQFQNNTPDYDPADEPTSTEVEFACTNEIAQVPGPGAGHTLAGVYSTQDANNLFDYSDLDPLGWTPTGLIRSVAARNASVLSSCKIVGNNGGGMHYFEKSVTLEAGKSYAFLLDFTAFNNSGGRIWLTHIRPDDTEHGIGFVDSGAALYTVPGSTDVSATGNKIMMVAPKGDNLTGDNGFTVGYLFEAVSSGAYKFRVHWTGSVSDPNTSSDPGFFAQLFVNAVALVEGPSKMQVPVLLPTSGAAILPGSTPYILPRPPRVAPSQVAFYPWSAFVMRRAGGKRPVCRLMNHQFRNTFIRFTDNEITDSRFMAQKSIPGNIAMRTSHSVYSFLSQQKFYMELKIDSFGSGGANECYTIGICPMETATTRTGLTISGTPPVTGDLPGQYSYTAVGTTYTDGTADGGSPIATWAVNDYIGVGIDFAAMEVTYYRNGTLLKTQAINSAYSGKMWVGLFGFFSAYAADKQARFTYNFKGPFGGRKPSGFAAFDFDNEVT